MDTTRLGQVSAELMESLSDEYADAELGEVMVLAEISFLGDEGEPRTAIAWRCSDDRAWVQMGLIHAALDQERIPSEDD